MRALYISATAVAGILVTEANAADLRRPAPAYKAPAVVVAESWAGLYAGAAIGYAWQKDNLDETLRGTGVPSGFTPISTSPDGVKLGGFLGYNWQFGAWVAGIEGDLEWADIGGSTANFIGSNDSYSPSTDWQASVRGRLGYAVGDMLIYATGGVAFANIEYAYNDVVPGVTQTFSSTRTGWTVGGGIDWRFAPNWFARVEYRYADFGDKTYSPTVFGDLFDEHHSTTEQAVRFGVAYKWGGTTVMAKY